MPIKLIQEGPRNARLMIVGEAPGVDEMRLGLPFQGFSGQLLDQMLARAGIQRHQCFITNLCHSRPPGNDFSWFYHKANQAHYLFGVMQLRDDIDSIKPNLILGLGAHPLRALTGKKSISDWRGSVLDGSLVPGRKVLSTYHPAAILRIWDYKAVVELDLSKVKKEMQFPEIRRMERELILAPEPAKRSEVALDMLNTAQWLSVDIECWLADDGKWKLACVGFSDRANRALTLPYAVDDIELHAILRLLLESPIPKVMQNGTFDCTVLLENGYKVNNFAWDTMLAHHSLYPESSSGSDEMGALAGKKRQAALSKGLAFLTSIYTSEPRYKDDGKLWKESGDINIFWRYNALDAAVTREIRDGQEIDLKQFGTIPVLEHSMSLVEPLMQMTRTGIKIDMAKRSDLTRKYEQEIVRLQGFLDLAAGQAVNVASNKQVTWLLYDKLGLPKQYNRKSKSANPSADKDIVVKLAAKYKHPMLLTLLKIREKRVMIERYLNAQLDSDNRMRCAWDITGTRSGRLSSRASLGGSGTNLQNIPSEMREMFIPDAGKVFVYRDFSQAEARIVAYLSRDQYLIDLFNDPIRDIHKETASKIFNIPIADVTSAQRYLGKKCRHAVNYGMEAQRFVEVVNEDAETTGIHIDYKLAQKVIDGFFMLHSNHKPVFWGEVEKSLKQTRTLNTPFGRKRTFFGRMDEKLLKEAYSYIPQSTVGDLCCKSLVGISRRIHGNAAFSSVDILLNVHDSILVQCSVDVLGRVAQMMAEEMAIPITMGQHTFTIPTDCLVGYNWMHKSEDNPQGLDKID